MTAPETLPVLSDEARRFLSAPRFGIVSCLNPDGSPLQAVIWYRIEGETIVFNSRAGRRWPTNIARDPRVSLTVADGYDYVDLRGVAEIVDEGVERRETLHARLMIRVERLHLAPHAQAASAESVETLKVL